MDLLINRFFSKRLVLLFGILVCFSLAAHCQDDGSDNGGSATPSLDNSDNTPLTPTQQATVKSYIQGGNTSNQQGIGSDMNQQGNQQQSLNKDSLIQNNQIKEAGPDATYGAYVFGNAAVMSLSELSIPPLDYPIGVGDHIVVALWGGGESQQTYIVARDGSIFPNGLGKIFVQGLTFEQARSLIYSRFKSIVPATTNIAVSLGEPRTITVNVGGEVKKPGPITVSAFSNAFNVIGLAGGVTKLGNLRAIQIKRDGKVIQVLDVYKYLATGEIGDHVYLQNNDFILVTFVDKVVKATGLFKRPMYYQLKKDEGMQALIKYAGGFASTAYTTSLKVFRTENEKQVLRNVNATAILKDSSSEYLLVDGDIVEADSIRQGINNKIQLLGAVTYPGVYEFKKGDRLFDIINRGGGVLKNTFMHRVFIFRGAADSTNLSGNSDRLELDISNMDSTNKLSVNDPNNVYLKPNDLVQLFTVNEFADPQYVDIFGEVRVPGHLQKYAGMTLQDLLYLSGGIKADAQYGRLEVSSVVDIDSAKLNLSPTRTVVRYYPIQQDLQLDSIAEKVVLRPFDQIYVRANPNYRIQENVQLLGLFKYPGFYPRLSTTEKLSDYVQRAGGFKDNADLSGAILFRQKVDLFRQSIIDRNKPQVTQTQITQTSQPSQSSQGAQLNQIAQTGVTAPTGQIAPIGITTQTSIVSVDSSEASLHDPVSIDLEQALKDTSDKQNIILQENDIIYVPEINPFVTIGGAVQSPLKVSFNEEHQHLGYYIDQAGGFGIHPWRKRIYVTYSNGKSRRTKNFAFFHFYPKVAQGSTVTVPQRPLGKALGDTVVQSLTTLVPVIIASIVLKLI